MTVQLPACVPFRYKTPRESGRETPWLQGSFMLSCLSQQEYRRALNRSGSLEKHISYFIFVSVDKMKTILPRGIPFELLGTESSIPSIPNISTTVEHSIQSFIQTELLSGCVVF